MRAGISTIIADPNGCLIFSLSPVNSNLGDYKRRVSRLATLDGGVAIVDSGFTHSDRTITLSPSTDEATLELFETLQSMCQQYSKVLLFLEDGAYAAVPEQVSKSRNVIMMRLLISGDPTNQND